MPPVLSFTTPALTAGENDGVQVKEREVEVPPLSNVTPWQLSTQKAKVLGKLEPVTVKVAFCP